ESVALAGRGRAPLVAALAHVAAGYAQLDLDDLDAAEHAAEQATALLAGLDLEPSAVLGARVLLAQVLRRRGRLEEALSHLDAALDNTSAPALLFPRRQALAHRAGTLLDLGRVEEALATAREAMASSSEDARSRVLALRAYGAALRAAGSGERAVEVLQEALDLARTLGQPSEVVLSERVLAGG
ncbi:MAG: adenylate/guanylate cyclase with repeat, partial [Frankiales bacterium]|nr:adenylate/guanylate cyclase with repeat [Frankiales bacterium]